MLSRRSFFAATAAVGAAGGFFGARLVEYLGSSPDTPWKTLTKEELPILEALAEQIIPADDAPGAKDAKVVRYLDWQLAPDAPYAWRREAYRKGLAALDALARTAHGKGFADCAFAEQTALLERVEREGGELRQFFDMAIENVKQGFYGHPRHGGNYRSCGWRMLGLPAAGCTGRGVLQ